MVSSHYHVRLQAHLNMTTPAPESVEMPLINVRDPEKLQNNFLFSVEITGDNGDVFYLSQSDPNQPTSLQGEFQSRFIISALIIGDEWGKMLIFELALDCENFVFKMVGDNGRDMTLKECQDYVNELAPKAPASLTKQFTNVDVPNTSRLK